MDKYRLHNFNEIPTLKELLPEDIVEFTGIPKHKISPIVTKIMNRILERVVNGDIYKAPGSNAMIFVEKYPYSFIEKHMKEPQGDFSPEAIPQYVVLANSSCLNNKLAVYLPKHLREKFMAKVNSGHVYPDMHLPTYYKNAAKHRYEKEAKKRVESWGSLAWGIS